MLKDDISVCLHTLLKVENFFYWRHPQLWGYTIKTRQKVKPEAILTSPTRILEMVVGLFSLMTSSYELLEWQ